MFRRSKCSFAHSNARGVTARSAIRLSARKDIRSFALLGLLSIPDQYSPKVPLESSRVEGRRRSFRRSPGKTGGTASPILLSMVERGLAVIKLGEIVIVLDLHRQGLSVSAIARQTGVDRKTIRKYIERGLEALAYGPRPIPVLADGGSCGS